MRSPKAAECMYAARMPATAKPAMTRAPKTARIRRLFKNLNNAPFANRFEPYIHLVIHELFNDIVADPLRHLRIAQWNRIHAAAASFGHVHGFIVLANVLILWLNRLPEFYVKNSLPENAAADRVAYRLCRNTFSGDRVLQICAHIG